MKKSQKNLAIAAVALVIILGAIYAFGNKGEPAGEKPVNEANATSTVSTGGDVKTPASSGAKSPAASSGTAVAPKPASATVSTGFIRVVTPNGGEQWKSGVGHTITWSDDRDVSNVIIYAANTQTGGVGTDISGKLSVRSSGVNSTASYFWNGTGLPVGMYRLTICNTDTKKCDTSDAPFAITQ